MKKYSVLIILAVIISSCAGGSPEMLPLDEVKAQFRLEKAAWEKQGLTHYRYTTRNREGVPVDDTSYTVTVYFGIPSVSAYDGLSINGPILYPDDIPKLKTETIDQYFKFIEERIEQWEYSYGNEPLVIRYNKQYHYPEYIGTIIDNTHWAWRKITRFEKLPSYDGPTIDEVRDEFRLEKAAWEKQRMTHYRFTTVIVGDSPPYRDDPYTVTVSSGIPRVTAFDGAPERVDSPYWKPVIEGLKTETIDQYFKFIVERIEYWENWYGGGPLVIRYNKQYHYPEYIGHVYFDEEKNVYVHWKWRDITEFENLE